MAMKPEKVAFVLFPYIATSEQIKTYANVLREARPNARLLISIPREREDLFEQSLLKQFDYFACGEKGDRLIARAMPLLSDLIYRDIGIIYLVTSTLRYSAENALTFADKCEASSSGILLLGEPPVLNPKSNPEIAEALKVPEIVQNLMVDVFTSYIACQTNKLVFGDFMNLTAGLFAFRTRHAAAGNALREMLAKISNRDSNLLSLFMALSMGANLSIRTVPLDTINLESFTSGLSRRIEDLRFVMDKLERQKYLPQTIPDLMLNMFSDSRFKMVFQDEHYKWFKAEVLGLDQGEIRKEHSVIKGDPMRRMPAPDLRGRK